MLRQVHKLEELYPKINMLPFLGAVCIISNISSANTDQEGA